MVCLILGEGSRDRRSENIMKDMIYPEVESNNQLRGGECIYDSESDHRGIRHTVTSPPLN